MPRRLSPKQKLVRIAKAVHSGSSLPPDDIAFLNAFTPETEEHPFFKYIQLVALPLSIGLGALFAAYPDYFDTLFGYLPTWTNLPAELLAAFDYMWTIIGEPVGKPNILFHLPNIVLYSFGILGIKNLFDTLNRRNWLDTVLDAQNKIQQQLQEGVVRFDLKRHHTLLFVGRGDYIAMQFAQNHAPDEAITISEIKPAYTDVWSHYRIDSHYTDLNNLLTRASAVSAGEYIFFPVQDIHLFLPGDTAYDLPPHRIDLLCQNIRSIERQNGWEQNKIFIVGDRYHRSVVRTEDQTGLIDGSEDVLSVESIAQRYENVSIIDPTEIVLSHILKMAKNRKIVFRATEAGIREYKTRFYERLERLGYGKEKHEKGVFIVGYDIFEDQIEQQVLCTKLDDYYPVVLSRNVYDALIRNGFKKREFIYVPELVLKELSRVSK